MNSTELSIHSLGDSALVLIPAQTSPLHQRQLHWLAEQLCQWQGIVEAVPGMGNLTLVLAKPHLNPHALGRKLARIWAQRPSRLPPGKQVQLDITFGGIEGPDLPFVARHCGLSEQEVVALHCRQPFEVAFLGFMPGFAYLSGGQLQVPRRAEPRLQVPAGSLALAGDQTGIYPRRSPGGWQLIGRTAASLFDPEQSPPALLQPGDRVQLVAL
ncbi:5-oxoprolinase subunit PxpB [Gallaecimonas sp. GXIMD4217]|uniref:5-oxoprolinase subunit PxpB n=1 Tax=Gallaecimonas sp. GXIMD4217 TaxID=3131927 RepID=UPI00311B2EEA